MMIAYIIPVKLRIPESKTCRFLVKQKFLQRPKYYLAPVEKNRSTCPVFCSLFQSISILLFFKQNV